VTADTFRLAAAPQVPVIGAAIASAAMTTAPDAEIHPAVEPLRFLLGRWRGRGVVGYPTIQSVRFGQELSFTHNGKAFLIYSSRSWLIEDDDRPGRPLATETGYWRPQPGGQIEVLLCHPTGIAEIYLGRIDGTKVELGTDAVVRTASAKEVTAGRRLYGMIGDDLGWAYDMAAVGQPLQPHASAQLRKAS
jgi:hypothetical protein